MIQIIIISIVYSLIRAKHDDYINDGQWKRWAVVEALFLSGAFTYLIGDCLLDYFFLPVLFGLWFSIFFDIFCGLFRARKLFYFGIGNYDQKMKQIFLTPFNFFTFKLFWLVILTGVYKYYIL